MRRKRTRRHEEEEKRTKKAIKRKAESTRKYGTGQGNAQRTDIYRRGTAGGGLQGARSDLSLWAENGWKENIERMMDLCSVAL